MRTIRIDINNAIYDHIMFFLKSLPSNLINIHFDNREENRIYTPKKESLRGVFRSYADPKKQALEDEAWKTHVLEKYKSSMND